MLRTVLPQPGTSLRSLRMYIVVGQGVYAHPILPPRVFWCAFLQERFHGIAVILCLEGDILQFTF
jgi:hypothetical protein